MTQPDPQLPGFLGNISWVSSMDYGETDRNGPMYDVDPAPLSKLIAALLRIGDFDYQQWQRAIAEDDRDGPIHIVRMLTVCEYAARQTGGHMPSPDFSGGDKKLQLFAGAVSGGAIPALMGAMREGGYAAATKLARSMTPEERYAVLDSIFQYWTAPITALEMLIAEESILPRRPQD